MQSEPRAIETPVRFGPSKVKRLCILFKKEDDDEVLSEIARAPSEDISDCYWKAKTLREEMTGDNEPLDALLSSLTDDLRRLSGG